MARVQGQGDEIAGDDLTRIIGIGTKTAERLRARGIGSFAALAAHAPGEIIALLHDVSGLSSARVNGWRSQARALQAEAFARLSSAADDPDPNPEPKPDTAKNARPGGWPPSRVPHLARFPTSRPLRSRRTRCWLTPCTCSP